MPLSPKLQHLYQCRYGFNGGRQICLLMAFQQDGYLVRKWRTNSGRWTGPVSIATRDLLAVATREEIARAEVKIDLQN